MCQDNKLLEKQFSSFERDLSIVENVKVFGEEMDFSQVETDFDLPTEPADEKSVSQEIAPKEDEEPKPEELPLEEEQAPAVEEELPKIIHPAMTGNDMLKMSNQLKEAIEEVIPLRDKTQRMVSGHNDIRLPKGLRSISIITARLTDVLIATKALVDLYLELGVEPLYQTVDDSRLKSTTSCTISTFQSHLPTIKEGLDDIEKIMEEGYDRPSANLRARIVKAQVKITHSQAIQQAKSLAQTIESFPIEYGSLKVLCLLAEKGDKEIMDSMDSALLSANHVQVPVSDAPSMLEAVKKNDQKAVDSIVRRMLGNS